MRRRDFITLLGGAAASWPLAVRAQQAGKLPTIGFLGADASAFAPWTAAFVARMRELGWIEGRTIAIEYRWSEGRPERYAEIAAEFVRLKVDAIVTVGSAVPIVKQATTTIPIVFAVGIDPVGSGLVASLAKPGGNVTGLSLQANDLAGKRLEFCARLFPNSAGWQSCSMLAIASPRWRCATLRPRLTHSASKSRHSKSGGRRISLPLSNRSRAQADALYVRSINSLLPTARASSRLHLARGCRRSSALAILSKPGHSCPTDQTIRICSGLGRLCGQNSARDEAWRYTSRAADQVRACHQSHDRQGARPDDPRIVPGCAPTR